MRHWNLFSASFLTACVLGLSCKKAIDKKVTVTSLYESRHWHPFCCKLSYKMRHWNLFSASFLTACVLGLSCKEAIDKKVTVTSLYESRHCILFIYSFLTRGVIGTFLLALEAFLLGAHTFVRKLSIKRVQ